MKNNKKIETKRQYFLRNYVKFVLFDSKVANCFKSITYALVFKSYIIFFSKDNFYQAV